jgi:hypothetical protein
MLRADNLHFQRGRGLKGVEVRVVVGLKAPPHKAGAGSKQRQQKEKATADFLRKALHQEKATSDSLREELRDEKAASDSLREERD